MFKRKSDEELWKLQQELLAAEEEEFEEEDLDLEDLEEYLEETPENEEEEGYEGCFTSDYEEEYGQEPFYRNHANGYGDQVRNYANRYGRGSPKRFDDDDFFDEDDFADEDVLYKKDYKKAKRKKRRQNFGLVILAILEIMGIAAILLWWASWAL